MTLRKQYPDMIMNLNMPDFLADPATVLTHVGNHFGLPRLAAMSDRITEGHVFRQYAKDSSVPWNSTVQQIAVQTRYAAFTDEVEEGVQFAYDLMSEHAS